MKKVALLMSIVMFLTLVGSCDWAKKDLGIEDYKAKYEAVTADMAVIEKEVGRLTVENKKINDSLTKLAAENIKLRSEVRTLAKDRIVVWTILFDNNQIYKKDETALVAQEIVDYAKMIGNSRTKITVEGYASKVGDADYNMWLSKERAEGVAHKIYSLGNDNNDLNIDIVAYGEADVDQRKVVVSIEVIP